MTASNKKRPLLQTIFVSPDEARLRAGWRLLLQVLIMAVLTVVVSLPAQIIIDRTGISGNNLSLVSVAIGVVASIWLARRFLDRRSYASLGLAYDSKGWRDLLIGILIAALIVALMFALLWAFGWLHVQGALWQGQVSAQTLAGLGLWVVLFIVVGYYEEVLTRGYLLQNIAEGLNLFWGVFISSALFGLLHLSNPHATLSSTLGVTAAGLFLAYGYLRTGSLWLSIGLHIGWNYFEGVVFGFPVSGLATPRIIQNTVTGPEWFTGGAFGPEAGLVSVLTMLVGAALIWLFTRNASDAENA